jgi:adenylosuccinate synthase
VRRFEDLPANARRYLGFLEETTGVEIGAVSVGAERSQTAIVRGSRLERLLES